MQKQEDRVESLVCPSFNSYSSDRLADIADRVTRDNSSGDGHRGDNDDDNYDDGDGGGSSRDTNDFEFVTFSKAADGVFFDGYVGPVFPIFNRDLLTADESNEGQGQVAEEDVMALRFPMRRLLNIDDDDQRSDRDPPSSSSSEVDDTETIPPGSYCVWTPNSAKASPSRCKKSNSTGSSSSSKRWKLLNLLRRSNSDGKNRDSFVFLTPSSSKSGTNLENNKQKAENSKERSESGKAVGKQKANGSAVAVTRGEKKVPVSAHEAFYVSNREMRKVEKRRSYLPYRQDLLGFCASLNSMGRPFPPL